MVDGGVARFDVGQAALGLLMGRLAWVNLGCKGRGTRRVLVGKTLGRLMRFGRPK